MPRFVELRNEKRDWMVVDTKSIPHKVLCTCYGYDAPINCRLIVEALEFHHNHLYGMFRHDATSSA